MSIRSTPEIVFGAKFIGKAPVHSGPARQFWEIREQKPEASIQIEDQVVPATVQYVPVGKNETIVIQGTAEKDGKQITKSIAFSVSPNGDYAERSYVKEQEGTFTLVHSGWFIAQDSFALTAKPSQGKLGKEYERRKETAV